MPLLRFSKSLVMCIAKCLTTRRGTCLLNDIVTISYAENSRRSWSICTYFILTQPCTLLCLVRILFPIRQASAA